MAIDVDSHDLKEECGLRREFTRHDGPFQREPEDQRQLINVYLFGATSQIVSTLVRP